MNKNRSHLRKLYETYGDFHVCKKLGIKWELFSKIDEDLVDFNEINHREVMPIEVVFDIDVKDDKKSLFYSNKITSKLTQKKISFNAYNSGNKGFKVQSPNHIHVFFPELANYPYEERCLMKEAIIDYFIGSYKQYANIDYQLCNKHMIRAEYSLHEKSGKEKQLVEKFRGRFSLKRNAIPQVAIDTFTKTKLDRETRKKKVLTNTGITRVEFPCIKYIMGEDFIALKDGKKRAMTILANYFNQEEKCDVYNVLSEWNDYKLNGAISPAKIRGAIYSIEKMHKDGRKFGCRYIKQLLDELKVTDVVCGNCMLNKRG